MIRSVNSSIHAKHVTCCGACIHGCSGTCDKQSNKQDEVHSTATHAPAVYSIYAHGTHAQQPEQPRYPDSTSKYENCGVSRCPADCAWRYSYLCSHASWVRYARNACTPSHTQIHGHKHVGFNPKAEATAMPKKTSCMTPAEGTSTITRHKWNSDIS